MDETIEVRKEDNEYEAASTDGTRKKRSYRQESLAFAYEGIRFTERPKCNQPGSCDRFFASSFTVSFANQDGVTTAALMLSQVVHRHVNGLCVVTAGENLPPALAASWIRSVNFQVDQAPACSTGQRRKRQAKMLKQGAAAVNIVGASSKTNNRGGKPECGNMGTVTPFSTLAELTLDNGDTVPLRACVWGTVLEINQHLTPSLLLKDPLLDGYLAIISPTGIFPPPGNKKAAG